MLFIAQMMPFVLQVWVATILTAVGVAVIVWAVEIWATAGKEPVTAASPAGANPKLADNLQQAVFTSLGRPMQVGCCAAARCSWLVACSAAAVV